MLTYALRRGLKPYDRRTVETIHRAVAADGYHFQTLVHRDRAKACRFKRGGAKTLPEELR